MNFETDAIQDLVKRRSSAPLVVERLNLREAGESAPVTENEFWLELVMSLLSSQQRSTAGSTTDRFRTEELYKLDLKVYKSLSDESVNQVLRPFRFNKRITEQLQANYQWLLVKELGWSHLAIRLQDLMKQRNSPPNPDQQVLERAICHELATGSLKLKGIGPKQSRNLLQALGLTRYEIPLDSRVAGWLQQKLGWNICIPALSNPSQYDEVLDRVQSICQAADVLPAIFDAAVFEDYVKEALSPTTHTGYVNRNGQVVIRNTRQPGTDKNQYVYQLGCSHCGNVYGANGSDIHLRLCPGCQSGAKGLAIE